MSTEPPSATVAVSAAATGAPFCSCTVNVKAAKAVRGGSPSSVAVMRIASLAGASLCPGVPLSVRLVASKESQGGSSPLAPRVAVQVTPPLSGSVTAPKV